MDQAIEGRVRRCHECQVNQRDPSNAPVHLWETPRGPWNRIHVDYAGPFKGKMFLIIADAYSKWIDVHVVNSSTSATTINKL